ncbi:hypothetical protein AWB80_06977 [Caballeronia pedi]|uniref:Uncharacterized protein n=1 Tax=Caballeronia pedi TaxID=1777141 RepID=A0A158DJ65_9BURK|nr:DUF6402 family protein [Caballeronia pedi]SAK94503.1 hypothetical protein AWB80_06977 [Caballeronia pedi]
MRIGTCELSYWKTNSFLDWKQREGCNPVYDVSVSHNQEPPVCEFGDDSSKRKEVQEEPLPPFDIQEIPAAMRLANMPVSAKLMERWFAGQLNYSPTQDDERVLINQDGQPYPASMFDTTTITLNWLLKFARAREAFNILCSREVLTSPAAMRVFRKKIAPFQSSFSVITNEICKEDMLKLHQQFQFQFSAVEGTWIDKLKSAKALFHKDESFPDDLTGALGSFNFYAAPREFHIRKIGPPTAFIYSVFIYVKDNYTFTDATGEVSQYLGHWSKKGVILVPRDNVLTALNIPSISLPIDDDWFESAVSIGNARKAGNVYYPIRNSSFRDWQNKHHRGGDFVIFSDLRVVNFDPPLEVTL